jgi:hypothetical protein
MKHGNGELPSFFNGRSRFSRHRQKQRQIAFQFLRDQKILLHVLVSVFA